MHCPSCNGENPDGKKFCGECGSPLAIRCANCDAENPPRFKFCGDCGTPLGGKEPANRGAGEAGKGSLESGNQRLKSTDQPQVPSPKPLAAERRQLTVLFCDLVGSTQLSEQLDPEEYSEVIQAYHDTCTEVVRRYDGHIAQHLGDGLLVYFGYPLAHEDDAQRAVRTGLEIISVIQEKIPSPLQNAPDKILPVPPLPKEGTQKPPFEKGAAQSAGGFNDRDVGRELQVRIGIHTGPVVISELGRSERREILALGETPNLAARIQGQAEPDTVAISAATYRLVQGLFECQDLGPRPLKGISTPQSLYRIVQESEARNRFKVTVRTGLTPLVGRDPEVGILQDRWAQAKSGAGQVVLLSGEPGIGKSRLAETLKEQILAESAARIEFHCSPYHQNSAFSPIIEHLQRLLQFEREDAPQARLAKLQEALSAYRFPQTDTVALLAALLSLPHPADTPPLTLSPQKQKQRMQETLIAWLLEEAERQALYCVWEDLHWADPSTLELLMLFLDQVPTARVLTVLTFRPEFTPPWKSRSHITQLALNRLGRQPVEAMVEQLTHQTPLPREIVQQVVEKTDGVPLFVEELTKSVIESVGATYASPPPLDIPTTLRDALMARLDRLGPAKEIAQLGATLGREFSYELLHAVSPLAETALQQGLQQLVDAELLYPRGLLPQVTYLFKHALVQDTAYQSLLKSKRQRLHQQIAHVLEERFPDTKETQPELLAHHYTEAGLARQAVSHWQKAGELTSKRLAVKEAIAYLNQGMALVGTLPPSPERDRQELDLRTRLGTAWITLKGWAAAEIWDSLYAALNLAKTLGRSEALIPTYFGLWDNVLAQGRVAESLDWVKEMLAIAETGSNQDMLLVAHWMAGCTYFWLGDLAQVYAHDDRALALYNEAHHPHLADLINTDPKNDVGFHRSLGAWVLGYPDRAVQLSDTHVAHVCQRDHPFDLGWALTAGGLVWDYRREPERLLARAEEAEQLGLTHNLSYLSDLLAPAIKGIAWLRAGRLAEGIPQLRGAIESFDSVGGKLWMPYYRAALAEGLALSGDLMNGLQLIEESLAQIARPGWEERWYLAEILRLKGWMLSLQGDLAGAEQQYLASLDVAHEQQAKSWELRTSTSLACLWQQQGKKDEAHRMLSEIYNRFTEGFDAKDLQEAKALLDELS